MTAAIMQNTVSGGTGWSRGRWTCDGAYQAQLPATQSVETSSILAGEYSNSKVRVWTQSVVITTRLQILGLSGTAFDRFYGKDFRVTHLC